MFIFKNFSTCFGHHYAHLQENKTYVTALGVLRCNKRGKLDISFNVFFVWHCVVNLDGISCVQNPGEPNPLLQMAINTSHPPT